MDIQPIKSSQIDGIGYDEISHKLRACFRKEKPRDFLHVPKAVFIAFLHARSKNRFYKRHIADCYYG